MSCCQTQLISGANLRDVTGTEIGVEDRKLKPWVEAAQYELEKILGTTLYDELETAYAADATLSTEADLLALYSNYVCPFLSWKALQLALPGVDADPARGGIFQRSGDDFAPASDAKVQRLVNRARDMADLHQERIIKFLKDNTTTYTTYNTDVNSEERIRKTYKAGIAFRRSKWQSPHGRRWSVAGQPEDDCTDCDDPNG